MVGFGVLYPAAQWFVDSVAGNNSNNGTSATTPLQTIAALLAKSIVSDTLIALKCGSTWRERLTIPVDRVHVCSYGTGAAPLLDCSEAISAGAWSKTGGQTSVYQAALTCEATGSTWISVWENDVRLVRVASIAAVDATPGSYFPSSDASASFTLYIQASNSTNPGVNGKTYDYSKRYAGYDAVTTAVVGCRVSGIQTRRNLANDGSLQIGKNGQAFDCTALDGTKHNVYVRTGGYCRRVTAQDAYFGGQSFILFVGNENTPNGEGLTFIDCNALMTAYDANSTGFYSHVNTSGSFGTLMFDGCHTDKCSMGFSGNNAARGIVQNCSVLNGHICYYTDSNWILSNISGQANQGPNPQIIFVSGTGVEVSAVTGSSAGPYWIWINANSALYIHDCDWSAAPLNLNMISLRGANASIRARQMKYNNTSPTLPYVVVTSAAPTAVIDSDFNTFTAQGASDYVGQIDQVYKTFAQWQALGYDTHSTIG